MESTDLEKLKRWRRSTFMVMLIGYIGYYLCRANLAAAFPLLSETFGYTNTQLGLLAFYSELAYAAGKFINGPLGDKVGGRPIFLLGMAGAVVFNVLFALGSTFTYFVVIWCACRYFLSMGWGGIAKTLGAWYEPELNGRVMGFVSISFQFGGVLATLFAGYLVLQGVGWKGLFVYPAMVLTAIWVWSFFASKGSPQDVVPGTDFGSGSSENQPVFEAEVEAEEQTSVAEIIKGLFRLELFRLLLVYSFFTTLLRSIFVFWLPKFFVDLGLGASTAILKSALLPLLGCVGTIGLGWYTDHYAKNGDRAKAMWIMLAALTLSLLGIAAAVKGDPNQTLVLLLTGACGFFLLGPYSMSSGCLTLDIAGSRGAGSCTGMLDGIGYIGGALSVWGAGKISDSLGWSEVFLVLAGFSLISTVAAYFMSQGFQRQAAAAAKA